MIGRITPDAKQAGERSAGKPHAAFDVAGAGNATMVAGLRDSAKALENPPEPTVGAPVLDPTRLNPAGWPTEASRPERPLDGGVVTVRKSTDTCRSTVNLFDRQFLVRSNGNYEPKRTL